MFATLKGAGAMNAMEVGRVILAIAALTNRKRKKRKRKPKK